MNKQTNHQLEIILQRAKDTQSIIQVVRIFEDSFNHCGFVHDFSSKYILIEVLSDRIDLDGYQIFRMEDIDEVNTDFSASQFFIDALKVKSITSQPPKVLVNFSSPREMIESIEEGYDLVAIERELIEPNQREIGRIRLTTDLTYTLQWITPEAEWADDSGHYSYNDITVIGFGGEYEETLAAVAEYRDKTTDTSF